MDHRRAAHAASRAMQGLVALALLIGVLTRNPSVVVNALLGLGVTLLPGVLERDYRVALGPALALWITAAVLLHTAGMLGLYDAVGWYDHLTHTVSATVVAGAGYATTRAVDLHYEEVYLPDRFMFVYILLFTLAFGVLWELLEFLAHWVAQVTGQRAVLVIYGVEDVVGDLVFDLFGALLVALFGTPTLAGVVERIRARLVEVEARR